MRIYFIGSHSSGKSTLCRYVSEKHNLPMITETARAVLAEKELQIDSLRADVALTNKYQTEVFYRQVAEERKYQDYVSDRSIIDCLAYSAQHSSVASILLKDPSFADCLQNLQKSIVFFVRPSKATLKNDGIRENVNWDGAVAIDAMIKFLLEAYNLRYFQINADNMQERIKLVDSVISLIK